MHYIMHISCQLLFLGEKTIWRVENMELVLVENQGYIFYHSFNYLVYFHSRYQYLRLLFPLNSNQNFL
jgi:hypothetical protein